MGAFHFFKIVQMVPNNVKRLIYYTNLRTSLRKFKIYINMPGLDRRLES